MRERTSGPSSRRCGDEWGERLMDVTTTLLLMVLVMLILTFVLYWRSRSE
jgi:hypothetical protein